MRIIEIETVVKCDATIKLIKATARRKDIRLGPTNTVIHS